MTFASVLIIQVYMRLLKSFTHQDVEAIENPVIYERRAARGIILDGKDILMIYTRRYNDYSFPGGGIDQGEAVEAGLLRELAEETGARNVRVQEAFGDFEEYRPTHYDGFDLMHQLSHFYVCTADRQLGQAKPESYEIKNGSEPVWVNIVEAIRHNQKVIDTKEDSMGLSIERETFVLRQIAREILGLSEEDLTFTA